MLIVGVQRQSGIRRGIGGVPVLLGLGLSSDGGAPPVAFEINLEDGGVVDEAVDGGDGHCWIGKTLPQSPNDWLAVISRSGARIEARSARVALSCRGRSRRLKGTLRGLSPLLQRKTDRGFLNDAQRGWPIGTGCWTRSKTPRVPLCGPRW
jgi:hypothetical protein